ncbi:hypothetical protein PPL_11134 [Heterostelium album PN500]|uniref:Prenylcysteine lyase domain-containing protein n=1 Tax=Heterostelium pallidum (strain ATCC 26659 / Pp 5 / PN500) TaxID=670386 RepID=D3BT13_HETP5|nr:hypothetical protein PPL_11134 [Heterostelium album PN500]EFA75628.1 hypothetical protein PPL_11134 [Heterostelium album PN500]|eukprot:XP_020427762.1 hypothetical protein PPL_11134 [Heterostelium album PN500]
MKLLFSITILFISLVFVVLAVEQHPTAVKDINVEELKVKPLQPAHDDHEARVKRFLNNKGGDHFSKRVAIIGGGIGGSSCAYYLHNQLGSRLEITVFEREMVGGRARIVDIDGSPAELGGSIIHPLNENINQLVKDLKLEVYYPEKNGTIFSIWNGEKMIFQQSTLHHLVDKFKMIYNYLLDPIRFKNSRDVVVNNFLKSYKYEEPFNTVQEFFDRIDLPDITKVTAEQFFVTNASISKPFIEEILSAAIRVNYNQDYDKIAAFAAMIALVGAEDDLYAIKGGNYLLAKKMLEKSQSATIKQSVKTIKKEKESYKITAVNQEGTEKDYEFDIVILATPLELANIKLQDIDNANNIVHKEYKTVNTYLIAATSLNPTYFGLPPNEKIPEHVLTSHNKSIPFFVASRNPRGIIKDGRTLFKMFSENKLDEELFSKLFNNHTTLKLHAWKAYPVLTPTSKFPPIKIDNNLYYINAFEHAVSTMETETIASKNL